MTHETITHSPSGTPAGWLGDPSGNHELRYWDGAQWTADVCDAGQQSQDPYVTQAPPPPPATANQLTPVTAAIDEQRSTNGGPPAPSGPAITGEAVSTADVREAEENLWESETQNLKAVASRGKVVNARYRLTNHALYCDTGVVGSTETRLALAQVIEVSVEQSMLQKRRGVGTLTIRFQNPSNGLASMRQIDSVSEPHELRDLMLKHANYAKQRISRSQRTFYPGS